MRSSISLVSSSLLLVVTTTIIKSSASFPSLLFLLSRRKSFFRDSIRSSSSFLSFLKSPALSSSSHLHKAHRTLTTMASADNEQSAVPAQSSVSGLIPSLPKSNLNEFGKALYADLRSDIDSLQQSIMQEEDSREQLFKKVNFFNLVVYVAKTLQ
jgi:hypothetical protein